MRKRNKMMYTYSEFDIRSFLDDYEIGYKEAGKNIGHGWIGLDECPFCGIQNNHAGINMSSVGFHCWGCNVKGTALKLVMTILKVNKSKALAIIKKYIDPSIEFEIRESGEEVIIPTKLTNLKVSGANYLIHRNYDPSEIIREYHIKQTSTGSKIQKGDKISKFDKRIYIPIYMNRDLVSFTARDYTGKQVVKYKHPFIEACIIPPASAIYNVDTVKNKRAFILEGPLDVWRMGKECVSLQGITVTKEQIRYLVEMDLKFAAIMFDAGKTEEAKKLAYQLAPFIKTVKVISLGEGDPGELDPREAVKLKMQIFTNVQNRRF